MVQERKRMCTQTEKVGLRRMIGVRPESKLYNELEKISKKEGISMNRLALRILRMEVKSLA